MWSKYFLTLYVPCFLVSACGGFITITSPFEVHRLGGSASAVGLVGGLFTATYVVGCLLLGRLADRFSPKEVVRIGLCLQAASLLSLAFSPSLTAFLTLAAVYGLTPSVFWPSVIAWLSAGYEGPSLNRRLGSFNLSWSSGMMVGPFVAGLMYEVHHTLPFFAATVMLLVSLYVASRMPSPIRGAVPAGQEHSQEPAEEDLDRIALFRPMVRVAHLLGYLVMGIFRYSVPTLAICLSIRSGLVGVVLMCLSGAMATAFYILGRTHRWHFRKDVLFGAQFGLAASLLAVWFSSTWWQMSLCVILGGSCIGVTYCSNLFYGVSGGKKRASSMVVHELLLSIGFIIGSTGGGWVIDYIGLRWPYPISAGLLVAGVLVQVVVSAVVTRRVRQRAKRSDGQTPSRHGSNV